MAQAWAAARGINLQVDFTIPVEPYGLDPNGLEAVRQERTRALPGFEGGSG